MSDHDENRRRLLLGAMLGAGAALAPETPAQAAPAADAADAATSLAPAANRHYAFFNADEAAAVEAFADRIIPSAPHAPGARDADVLNYIDLSLAGAYADSQEFYRHGLAQLDAFCNATYKDSLAALTPEQQDAALTALDTGKATGFAWPAAQAFFNTVRIHTIEGMFADPVYGGNKDFAGWRLVGFPGAQTLYTKEDMDSTGEFTRIPTQGLQAQVRRANGR